MVAPRITAVSSGLASFVLLLLNACGGGSGGKSGVGGNAPPLSPPPSNFTVGGTITGLVGSVTLQNNGGDALTLIENGSFSFVTRISAGGRYSVAVSSQPSVPDCVVTNGSGNANGNVSNVSVICAVDPATRFIPMSALRPTSAVCGIVCFSIAEGLFVLSTKHIEREPIRITPNFIREIAVVPEHVVSANATVTLARPAILVYRMASATDGEHLWALDLSGDSKLEPRQLSALTFRSANVGASSLHPALCGARMILNRLGDPSSAFLVVQLSDAPEPPCSGNLRSVMVRLADSPTTVPRSVKAGSINLQPIYRSDATLAGIVGHDPATQGIVFFADDSFESSRPLISGASYFETVRDRDNSFMSSATWSDLTGSQTSTSISVFDGSERKLFSIDNKGTAKLLYDLSNVSEAYRFGENVFVQDQADQSGSLNTSIIRIPLDGAAPQTLLSNPPDVNCNADDRPVGMIGVKLIVWRTCWVGTRELSSHILSLPGPALGTATTLASYTGALLDVSVALDRLLISFISLSANSTPFNYLYDYATTVLDSAGNVLLAKSPGAFLTFQGDPPNTLLQVRDVTGSGLKDGVLYKLTVAPLVSPVFSRIEYGDTTPVRLPLEAVGGKGTAIAPGLVYSNFHDHTTANYAAIVDLSRGRFVRLTQSNINFQLISFVN